MLFQTMHCRPCMGSQDILEKNVKGSNTKHLSDPIASHGLCYNELKHR